MKFDMGKAWNDAMALLAANRDVVMIVAGVFFLLPQLAAGLLISNPMASLGSDANLKPEQIMDILLKFYASHWWVFVLLVVAQYIGVLGLLSLLTDRARPTVGEALKFGAMCMLPYIGAVILMTLAMAVVISIPMAIGAALGGVAGGVVVVAIAIPLLFYLSVKFSLAAPVMAIEKQFNPVTALIRSWQLTKGNSFRLFFFYALLLVALLVISMVISFIIGTGLAIMGQEAAMIGNSIIGSIINAGIVTAMLGIWAAIHRQLSGGGAAVASAFD